MTLYSFYKSNMPKDRDARIILSRIACQSGQELRSQNHTIGHSDYRKYRVVFTPAKSNTHSTQVCSASGYQNSCLSFSKGYDGPADVQRAVDESSLDLLSLLFLLAHCGQSQCIMVRHRYAVKIKLIHLNGHPAQTHRSTQRSREVLVKSTAKKKQKKHLFLWRMTCSKRNPSNVSQILFVYTMFKKPIAEIHHHKRLVRNCTQKMPRSCASSHNHFRLIETTIKYP